jgi:hypothetical protein
MITDKLCVDCGSVIHKDSTRCRHCAAGKHLKGKHISKEHSDKLREIMKNRVNPATTPEARKKLTLKALLRHNHKDRSTPAMNQLYGNYRNSATLRGFNFDLSKEDFKILTSGNCEYCNDIPRKRIKNGRKTSLHISFYTYNGIDRVDNARGYSVDNCVPCCSMCNKMKRANSVESFLGQVNKIAKNMESKKCAF